MLTDALGEKKQKKTKIKIGKEEIRVGQKTRGKRKRSVKEGEKKGRKKRVIGKNWALPGTAPRT